MISLDVVVESSMDFMLRVLGYIKVFESGNLLLGFLDGTEIECRQSFFESDVLSKE